MKGEKIQISYNKTLKLTNVLIKEIDLSDCGSFEKEVFQMEDYLKNKGGFPVGPLIHYTNVIANETQQAKVVFKILRQSNIYLRNIEQPYKMKSQIIVENCMYSRYVGEESKLKFAYDKINLVAFEEDINLKGDSYTIFISNADSGLITDVFMEKA